MENYMKTVIVNELLLSLQHAIITCKLSDDIAEAFSNFYEEAELLEARTILLTINEQRSTSRKFDKKKCVIELLEQLRKDDFMSKNVTFAAINLFKICNINAGIGEELRYEIKELRGKYTSLTSAIGELRSITTGFDSISTEIKSFNIAQNKVNPKSYLAAAHNGMRRRHVTGESRPPTPASPPLTQKIATARDVDNEDQVSCEDNDRAIDNDKRPYFPAKQRKKRPPMLHKTGVGGTAESNVKSILKPRVGILFLTRCTPTTTCDDISSHISEKVKSYKLLDVERWKAKHESYSSFKLCFNIEQAKLSTFLKDTIKAELWPASSFVKPFGMTRLMKPSLTQS